MNDTSSPAPESDWKFRPFAEIMAALRFLTRVPLPFLRTLDLPPLAVAMRFFPVAGAIIGCVSAALLISANMLGAPSLLAAVIALGATVMLTGALHEDGLADVADGFGGGTTPEQRLEIMRDSHMGAYGTIALVLALLAKAAIFEALTGAPPLTIFLLLASAAAFSRALVVDLLWATKPARTDGLAIFAGRPSKQNALLALLGGGAGALLAASLAISPMAAILAMGAGFLTLAIMRALAMRRIGGQTGDVCGATQVLTELAMLTVLAATIS